MHKQEQLCVNNIINSSARRPRTKRIIKKNIYKYTEVAYYNNNENPTNNDSGRDVWQRQQDILALLKLAEMDIFKGIDLQNPYYEKEIGPTRNRDSVGFLLAGARKYHFVLQSLLKDTNGIGLDSEKDGMYKTGFNIVQDLMNQSTTLGVRTPIGEKKLTEAYDTVMNLIYVLREDVSETELDFKKKKNVYDSWMD